MSRLITNMNIDIKLIIDLLQTSDFVSEDVAIAKGKYKLAESFSELRTNYKNRRNGNK